MLSLLVICYILVSIAFGDGYVGMNYETWFNSPAMWNSRHVSPQLGLYYSNDSSIIIQHNNWMIDVGIDFVHIDWSNNDNPANWNTTRTDLGAIVTSTTAVFDVYSNLDKHSKIALLLDGLTEAMFTNGWLQQTVDFIYDQYILNKTRNSMYFYYKNKPLITIYLNTPAWCGTNLPKWTDNRFAVRWMTGFLESQSSLISLDVWSWISRFPIPASSNNGVVESMTTSDAWPGQSGWGSVDTEGRNNGTTYQQAWEQVLAVNPPVVFICQWNEYAEEASPNYSNEIEPTVEFGNFYLELTKQYISKYRTLN
eukprot:114758_1